MKLLIMRFPIIPSILLIFILFLSSCDEIPSPKLPGYPRILFPEHEYKSFNTPQCPFTFEYPSIGNIGDRRIDSCWVDIDIPQYQCKFHITYKPLNQKVTYSNAYEDYRKLIYKHSQKASEIVETPIKTKNGIGTFFEIYGEVPTSAQFLYSDSTHHAVMCSFYFETALKNDSLKPVIDYFKKDVKHLIQSIHWK